MDVSPLNASEMRKEAFWTLLMITLLENLWPKYVNSFSGHYFSEEMTLLFLFIYFRKLINHVTSSEKEYLKYFLK